MASQNLNVGTGANANDGDTLRAAFINVRKMFHDIYGISDAYTDGLDISGEDFKINANQINTTNSAVDGYVLTYDNATGGFTFEEYFNGDITRVTGGSGLSGDTETGVATINIDLNDLTEAALDVANDDIAFVDTSDSNTTRKESIADVMTAVAGTGLSATSGVLSVDSIDTDGITDDAVTHAKLEDRYTERTDLGSGSSFAIDFSGAAIYEVTANANATLTFSEAKQGQVVDIIADGNFTFTFSETGSTFNQVGSGTYDGSTDNLIQVVCTDDTSGSKVYHYSVGTFTSSTSA